jgi:hypothetical protein
MVIPGLAVHGWQMGLGNGDRTSPFPTPMDRKSNTQFT